MKNLLIRQNSTLKEALKKLNNTGEKCLVVVNQRKFLLGTLSDGDVRKAILKKDASMNASIKGIYHRDAKYFVEGEFTISQAKRLLIKKRYDIIPIINKKHIVKNVILLRDLYNNNKNKNIRKVKAPVVIMAGGRGTRMEPFTKILPKPLIPINEKPVIEHIIEKFNNVGVKDFYMTLNYKSHILKAFFEESKAEHTIKFINEIEPLGTAGSLKFLIKKIKTSFILIPATYLSAIIFTAFFGKRGIVFIRILFMIAIGK